MKKGQDSGLDLAQIDTALAGLGKMAAVAKAFEDAQIVLNVLAGAKQALGEINAQTESARQELDEALREVATTRETARTLEAQARSTVDTANEEAEKLKRSVEALATRMQSDAEKAVTETRAKADAEEQRYERFRVAIAEAQDELSGLNAKLDAARQAARKYFEDD